MIEKEVTVIFHEVCDICSARYACKQDESSPLNSYVYGEFNRRTLFFCRTHRDAEVQKAVKERI